MFSLYLTPFLLFFLQGSEIKKVNNVIKWNALTNPEYMFENGVKSCQEIFSKNCMQCST